MESLCKRGKDVGKWFKQERIRRTRKIRNCEDVWDTGKKKNHRCQTASEIREKRRMNFQSFLDS